MRRLLLRHVLAPDDKYVGILLPPSVGSVIANAALSMDGRVTANLNYTATPEVLNSCLSRAGIRQILTSRKVMANPVFEKFKDTLDAEFVYLEDLREKVLRGDKLYGVLQRVSRAGVHSRSRAGAASASAAMTWPRSSSRPAPPACPRA